MIYQTVKTRKNPLVLQVYHNHHVYQKDKKSYETRKHFSQWHKNISTLAPCFKAGKLSLVESQYSTELNSCDLIIINDINASSPEEAITRENKRGLNGLVKHECRNGQVWESLNHIQSFTFSNAPRLYELFLFKVSEKGLEVHLHYDLLKIGEPKRENFRLCELVSDVPVEIKINGKLDHSLTSGRERKYKEHCYIFHLLGPADELEIHRDPPERVVKDIPVPVKVIDLMKQLY